MAPSLDGWYVDGAHEPAVAILSRPRWHRARFQGFCVIRTHDSIGERLSSLIIVLLRANPYSFREHIYL